MSWATIFALLKRFYGFSQQELFDLTITQVGLYLEQIQEIMFMLGEAERPEDIVISKQEVIDLIKDTGHRIPRKMKNE